MTTNANVAAGLASLDTTFISQWGEVMTQQLAGIYQNYTQEFTGGDVKARTIDWTWVTRVPTLRKWLGSRLRPALRAYEHSVTLEPYEATLSIDRMLVDYDRAGALALAVKQFVQANAPARSYDRIASALFDSGASGVGPTCFDGQALFSASHPHGPVGATTQSNLGAGTALSAASVRAVRAAGGLLMHENGEPAEINYNVMRVGPTLEMRALELMGANRILPAAATGLEAVSSVVVASTIDNTMANRFQVVIDQRRNLTGPYYADFIDTTKEAKPMFMYLGRDITQTTLTGMDSPRRINDNKYEWLLDADVGITAGHWLTCYRLTGTA